MVYAMVSAIGSAMASAMVKLHCACLEWHKPTVCITAGAQQHPLVCFKLHVWMAVNRPVTLLLCAVNLRSHQHRVAAKAVLHQYRKLAAAVNMLLACSG
jgi:hypothetical protein